MEDLPALLQDPAGNELVVSSVERTNLAPEDVLVGVLVQKSFIFEDARANGTGAARDATDSTVNGIGRGEVKVGALETHDTAQVPEVGHTEAAKDAADTLAGANDPDLLVLEGG